MTVNQNPSLLTPEIKKKCTRKFDLNSTKSSILPTTIIHNFPKPIKFPKNEIFIFIFSYSSHHLRQSIWSCNPVIPLDANANRQSPMVNKHGLHLKQYTQCCIYYFDLFKLDTTSFLSSSFQVIMSKVGIIFITFDRVVPPSFSTAITCCTSTFSSLFYGHRLAQTLQFYQPTVAYLTHLQITVVTDVQKELDY